MTTIGSLCSGYGGLEMGLRMVVDADVAWHAEVDPGASRILAHRYPGLPNLGDITAVDWAAVESVDWLCAGWPCQPWSSAGKRKGADDERAIWPEIARAVRDLRPRWVLLENVARIVVVGELARAVGDLADLGYDAQWTCLRASDAGAPHGRQRCFAVAADTADQRHQRVGDARRRRPGPTDGGIAPADASSDGRHEGRAESARIIGRPDAPLGGDPATPDPDITSGEARSGRQGPGDARRLQPVERGVTDWAGYGPAVRRWEHVTRRAAPRPTEPGRSGERLSPRFVEWMMGLPAGWVTDVPDLTRNAQLKALGNGVVPQQAAAAVRSLLPVEVGVAS